jgi:ubiquinol-cytochrome c reductase cytochrome b subunit
MIREATAFVRNWLSERYPVDEAEEFIEGQAGKPLPAHVSYLHTFGSLALFLMANQIITGILLMVYYRPTGNTAFESVKFIMTKAQLGWLIRGLHAWGANIMIATVVLHMLRTFMMGSFKKPRELTWVLGCFIFFTVLGFGFTGYLLPWNQLSYWATTVGTEVAGAIPWFGTFIKYLLRGGVAVGEETLSRFYVVHVVILPWVLVGMVSLHIILMRVQGLAPMAPVGEGEHVPEGQGIPFYPDHVFKELVVFPLLFILMLGIVILLPVELGDKANPFVTPEGIKPEWYFLPSYQLLKYFPKLLGIFVAGIPMLLLLLWPFLDRGRERRPSQRPLAVLIGTAGLLFAIFFGIVGYMSERNVTWHGQPYHIDLYGIPHRLEKSAEQSAPQPAQPAAAEGGAGESSPQKGSGEQ